MFDKRSFLDLHEPCKVQSEAGKLVPFAKVWLEWIGRRQYDGIGFYPDNKVPGGYFNLWRGFGVQPREGDWAKLRAHLLHNIRQGNHAHYVWLMDWLADIFQHPTAKKDTHVVLRGKEGTGKTKLL